MAVLRLLQFSELNCNLRQLHHYHHDTLEARALGRREWNSLGGHYRDERRPEGKNGSMKWSGISKYL
jgi:hypothetical protein